MIRRMRRRHDTTRTQRLEREAKDLERRLQFLQRRLEIATERKRGGRA